MSGRINAWVVSTPELRYLARKYNLPDYLIASLNVDNPRVLEQIAEAAAIANDPEEYGANAVTYEKLAFFGRPLSVKFAKVERNGNEYVKVTIKLKTATLLWYIPMAEWQRRRPREWIELFRNWMYIIAKRIVMDNKKDDKQKKRRGDNIIWIVEKAKFVNIKSDRETARRLIEAYARRYDFPVITAILSVLGYHPEITGEPEAFLLLLARVIPAASVDPVHAVEFTVPGTGKTTIALIYETALRWRYFAEVPSVATLVGDARTGASLIASADGIWFDEFDAWVADSRKRSEMRELIETLLTGMWQGKWKRSKGGALAPEATRPIPVYHSGNVAGPEHPRNKLMTIIKAVAPDKAAPYNDRIGIAVTAVKAGLAETIQEWTLSNKARRVVYGRPSVIRGIFDLVQEAIVKHGSEPTENPFKGRMAENYRRVYRALTVLLATNPEMTEYDEDKVKRITKLFVEGVVIQ